MFPPAKAQVGFYVKILFSQLFNGRYAGFYRLLHQFMKLGQVGLGGSSGLLGAADLTEVGSGTLEPGISSTQGSFVQKPAPLLKMRRGSRMKCVMILP
ncbi:MAG: hypothetical protein Ct9H300mP19_18920 [Dehalococcoidia bacterium]|nr:MAG: hypothetical protein Ct9H300mP19_18920 [Dehalococcoidia bacterium]